jgi:hypothetical protein
MQTVSRRLYSGPCTVNEPGRRLLASLQNEAAWADGLHRAWLKGWRFYRASKSVLGRRAHTSANPLKYRGYNRIPLFGGLKTGTQLNPIALAG